MSNLTNNTAELRDILAAVNALPDAGSGGNVETCTVTINIVQSSLQSFCPVDVDLMVLDKNYNGAGLDHYEIYPFTDYYYGTATVDSFTHTITVPKNSLVYVFLQTQNTGMDCNTTETGDVMYMGFHRVCFGRDYSDVTYEVFYAYGDCTITATAVER